MLRNGTGSNENLITSMLQHFKYGIIKVCAEMLIEWANTLVQKVEVIFGRKDTFCNKEKQKQTDCLNNWSLKQNNKDLTRKEKKSSTTDELTWNH